MDSILDSFLGLGIIDKIDGNDERYIKIRKAAEQLSEYLREERLQLIPAILTGLDPNVSTEEPIIAKAKEYLSKEWKAYLTAYTDEPINLYRSIILESCLLVSKEDNNAAIMWLTAFDVFPVLKCGKEEEILRSFMMFLGQLSEKKAIFHEPELAIRREKTIKLDDVPNLNISAVEINKNRIYTGIAEAAAASYIDKEGQNVTGKNPNRYWPASNAQWAGDFATRMSNVFISELSDITTQLQSNSNLTDCIHSMQAVVEKALNDQRLLLQKQQRIFLDYQKQEQTRLNVLWWAEALYSQSQKESYRAYPPELAAVLMSFDLLQEIQIPSPASVAYTLSETVNKLPEGNYRQLYDFYNVLIKIKEERFRLQLNWIDENVSGSRGNKLNIRDIVIQALVDEHCDLEFLIKNSFVPEGWKCNLPSLSRAIYRQEQAYRLVMGV